MDVSPPPFNELLQRYRGIAGLSQQELAGRAGLSRRGISDLERGVRRLPHPTTLRRIANALQLDPVARSTLLASAHAPRAARGPTAHRSRLPIALTSLVGREREVAEIRELLGTTRLLSLVGGGGIGKTRLALEAVRCDVLGDVHLVELAPVVGPELVARSVARALNVVERADQPLADSLMEHIGDRPLLLFLDNCEHLVDACASLVDRLLRACPRAQVLTTSREALGVSGELVWRVPALSHSEATRLFVQSASHHRAGFVVTAANAESVAGLCARLDGIPLAIELAAARVPALSVEQITARLDVSLDLLTRGGRTAVDRQRTLRSTLDWSYELLSELERRLYTRLAVFAGGWTVEAAESVCSGPDLEQASVMDMLSNLVDKSMVVAEERDAATWYRLLDPVRTYAMEKLRAAGGEQTLRSRHLDWYVELAEEFERDWRGPRQKAWFGRIEREESNLRTALRWCLDTGDLTNGLRLAGALGRFFWDLGNRAIEGRAWLSQLLGLADASVSPRARAKALTSAGFLAAYQGDTATAEALLAQALRCWQELDDAWGVAEATVTLGVAALYRGDSIRATTLFEQGLTLARELGDRCTAYWALHQLASNAQRAGDDERAETLHKESLTLKRLQGDAYGVAMSLHGLAQLEWLRGNHDRALTLLRESLSIFHDLGHWRAIVQDLQLLAHVMASRGDAASSTCLFGVVGTLQRALGDRRSVAIAQNVDPMRTESSIAANRARLSRSAYTRAWQMGEAMTIREAVALALGAPPARSDLGPDAIGRQYQPPGRDSRDPGGHAELPALRLENLPVPLTRREREILRLILSGHTNQGIATALVLSLRTVERHTSNLYSKLGVHSRAQALAFALRHADESGIAYFPPVVAGKLGDGTDGDGRRV